jgi:hypothetical protein
VTEIVKIPGRGHALTIDGGWREVADTALGFIKKHAERGFDESGALTHPACPQMSYREAHA